MAQAKKWVEKGQKLAEKWTPDTVLPILTQIWERLIKPDDPHSFDGNVVRANDIKLLGEICLMFDVTKERWRDWQNKFEDYHSISLLMKKIKWVLECRLNYSGQTMDIFILKNHYDYADRRELTGADGGPIQTQQITGMEIK